MLPLGVILQQTMNAPQFHDLLVPSLIVWLLVNLAEQLVYLRHKHLQLLELLRYASFSSGVMLGWWADLLPAVAGKGSRMGVAGAGEVTPDCCAE